MQLVKVPVAVEPKCAETDIDLSSHRGHRSAFRHQGECNWPLNLILIADLEGKRQEFRAKRRL